MAEVRPFPGSADKRQLFSTRVVRVSSLADKEPADIQYVVPGIIPVGLVTLVSGPSGIGKTQLFQQLMTSCATEKPWIGREVHGCRSFAIFSEESNDRLHARQKRINEHYEVDMLDFEDKASWIPDDDAEPILVTSESRWHNYVTPTILWQQVAGYCRDNQIGLLILDNVGTVYAGDEYNKHQVRSFVRFLNTEARKINDGIAIVLLMHPPKDRQRTYFAGSQQWENSPRNMLSLEWPQPEEGGLEQSDELTLYARNGNYVPHDDPLRRHGLTMKWENGILVPRETEQPQHRFPLDRVDKLILDDQVRRAVAYIVDKEGGRVALDPRSPNSLPARCARSPKWRGYTRDAIAAAVERLVDGNKLVRVALGGVWLVRPPELQYLGETLMENAR